MRVQTVAAVSFCLLVGLAAPLAAGRQDPMEVRMKWAMAQVVHYDVIGEYSGPANVMGASEGHYWKSVPVKDRFEISFDWAPQQRKLVGKPIFKNLPSTVPGPAQIFAGACQQPPAPTGAYEHLTIVETAAEFGDLLLTTTRTRLGGAIPFVNEQGKCGFEPATASTDNVTHRLPVIPGTFLATPNAAPTNIEVGEEENSKPNKVIVGTDGKTMILDDSGRGWKYTYTLSIAK